MRFFMLLLRLYGDLPLNAVANYEQQLSQFLDTDDES